MPKSIQRFMIVSNILKAFVNIVNNYQSSISTLSQGKNRANNLILKNSDMMKQKHLSLSV